MYWVFIRLTALLALVDDCARNPSPQPLREIRWEAREGFWQIVV